MSIAAFARTALLVAAATLLLLIASMSYSLANLRAVSSDMEALAKLQHRVSSLAAPASATLLGESPSSLHALFQRETRELIDQTRELGEARPDAQKAAHHLEQMLALNEAVRARAVGSDALQLSPRAEATLLALNEHLVSANSALWDALSSARAGIGRSSNRIHLLLIASSLLFGIACILSLFWIDQRVGARVALLHHTVKALRSGFTEARAEVSGKDEIATFGHAFNELLDEQAHALAALRDHKAALEENNDLLAREATLRRHLIDSMPANIATIDADGCITDTNQRWRDFGVDNGKSPSSDFAGINYLAVCDGTTGKQKEDAERVATGLREIIAGNRLEYVHEYPCHAPGRPRWYRMMARRLGDGTPTEDLAGAVVIMHVDVTEQRLAQDRLQFLAFNDELTGLLSRRGLLTAVAEMPATDIGLLLMLDLIDFHAINDSFGPGAGNEILKELARRLRSLEPEALARTAADTFALYFQNAPAKAQGAIEAELDAGLARPFKLNQGETVRLAANVGVYAGPAGLPVDPEELYRRAETALFHAREAELPKVYFTSALAKNSAERVVITRDLHRAVDNGELELHFQPQVDLQAQSMVACEALLRWRHPERGLQSPASFIPLAEQSQLIVPIGSWVLHEACRQLKAWQQAGMDLVSVAVNVSLVQFTASDFIAELEAALNASGICASQLTLEVTESAFCADRRQLAAMLARARSFGVRLSLDDFGTGYSSLQYLKDYPFQEVKIDQTFVRGLLQDRYSESIVRNVIDIARAIDAEPLAEGIEDEATAARLLALGCSRGQGYYYSLPLEAEDFRWLLQEHSRLPL